ncbi:hypothetical protein [Chryseobacterium sp. KMC2]|uniref:hypothetical protein n=1 Tax=Chryseobacterium sp. KMC2 TaxID=2800705 RepID=UPI0019204F68|nr:hypothetical protein [Chryseobacterium sp. KMC2]MBL3547236.1 hypothetical protein [Chryseobacterium sp. KMC2]
MANQSRNNKKIQDFEKEKLQAILQYKESVESTRGKSQDDFEKSIYLLGSGGLIVSLMAIEKIIELIDIIAFKYFFVIGLFCFVATLFSNLLSHKKSITESEKIIDKINQEPNCIFEDEFTESLENGNKKIDILNRISIVSLITGIISILLFFTLNFFTMSDKKPQPQNPPKPLTEEKGRTISTPPKIVAPKKN